MREVEKTVDLNIGKKGGWDGVKLVGSVGTVSPCFLHYLALTDSDGTIALLRGWVNQY